MNKKFSVLFVVVLLASLLLTACGPSVKPDIPVYPNATVAPAEYESTRADLEKTEKDALTGYNVELTIYNITAEKEEIFAYYTETLKDWKTDGMEDKGNGLFLQKWTKGNSGFVVFFAPDYVALSGNMLTTEVVWK